MAGTSEPQPSTLRASRSTLLSLILPSQVSQVGAERTIGTIVGGSLGFVVYGVGSKVWNDATDGVVLSITASVVAFLGVVVGARLGLDLSARLFTITFLLVTFGAQEGKGAAWRARRGTVAVL